MFWIDLVYIPYCLGLHFSKSYKLLMIINGVILYWDVCRKIIFCNNYFTKNMGLWTCNENINFTPKHDLWNAKFTLFQQGMIREKVIEMSRLSSIQKWPTIPIQVETKAKSFWFYDINTLGARPFLKNFKIAFEI